MRPYYSVPIEDCDEPLVPIPLDAFAVVQPHPYEAVGAPYGSRSPYYLRQGVLDALTTSQTHLQQEQPGWQIQVFDAYRPIAVQQYMVDYTFAEVVEAQGLTGQTLSEPQRQDLLEQVYEFWAVPSADPKTPPPHSTGSAVDLTLVDDRGQVVDMGSPIDEISPRSYPDHFAESQEKREQQYHGNRQTLLQAMTQAGFQQNPREWWHFSLGDQMWAWAVNQANPAQQAIARYGRVESA